ncbi:MAG: 5'/3'-nucleotidase SurE [Planctomycetota bacterium]
MRLLCTNDDGIDAGGLHAIRDELAAHYTIDVVAPATVQSAKSHSLTLGEPLMVEKRNFGDWDGTAVAGSPADCVKLAVDAILPQRPDAVVSGINHGANSGINVVYSGTVAAAIEGAFLGLPAIALSLHFDKDADNDLHRAARWSLPVVEKLLPTLGKGEVVNVNLPALPAGESPKGIHVCRQCVRPYVDTYEHRISPGGRDYYWNNSQFRLDSTDADTDVAMLRDKYITVTPLQFDLTKRGQMEGLVGLFS